MVKTRSDWLQKNQVMRGFVILLIAIGTILNSRIAYFFIILNTENNKIKIRLVLKFHKCDTSHLVIYQQQLAGV